MGIEVVQITRWSKEKVLKYHFIEFFRKEQQKFLLGERKVYELYIISTPLA
jgi:hypothetical protein